MLNGIDFKNLLLMFALGAVVCTVLEGLLLPLLRRLKAGQAIREDGPQGHLKKAGTPTMGGFAMILTCIAVPVLMFIFGGTYDKGMAAIVLVMAAFGAIGFCDDYIKVVKKHNEGLTPKQKMILLIVVALIYSVYIGMGGKDMYIPFIGMIHMPAWFVIPFEVFVIIAMTNAVNLTDGLDGLCSSVTLSVCVFFALAASKYLAAGADYSAILAGSCVGFLVYNHHPAKVFMGDTGSLAIGGGLAAMAISSGIELFLPVVGIIYVLEALSVIIQVYVFKTQNGRRFFRMAPLHHHFELGGWSEVKVDTVFSLVTIGCGILSWLILMVAE